MATILEKDLVRETTIKKDNREIVVTIKSDQTISFRLKGLRTGEVSIPIETLYDQLSGTIEPLEVGADTENHSGSKISLHDVRSAIAISDLEYSTISKIDSILSDLVRRSK